MGTYTMTCVGYDTEFLRVLERNAHGWAPPLPKKKTRLQDTATISKGRGSKRKPIELGSDDELQPGHKQDGAKLDEDEGEVERMVSVSEEDLLAPGPGEKRVRRKRARTSGTLPP